MSTGLETTVDEPFLFHCGQRLLFPQVDGAAQLRALSDGYSEMQGASLP
jgi:hypothetical protein